MKQSTDTVRHTRTVLTGRDILRMCRALKLVHVTKDTQVLFTVPGGADWSGMTIEIDKDNPIVVTSKHYDTRHARRIRRKP